MTKRKASFYAVRVGKQPGVYDNWEACKVQVLGFPGSQYKGFQTRAEAESYVNDTLATFKDSAISSRVMIQTQTIENFNEKHTHPLPSTSISKGGLKNVTSSKKAITSPRRKIPALKEEVTSSSQPALNNPFECYKLVEENGQQFAVFESLNDFDSHFKVLCRSRHSCTRLLESSSKNQEMTTSNQSSEAAQHLQTKVAMEDDKFVYFKDENDLKEFLEPYFADAKQRAVSQTTTYSQNRVPLDREPVQLVVIEGVYQLEFDGASKGNPGRAGAGALIRCPHGSVVLELTEFLGSETNNVAEYRALILGLKAALSKGIRRVKAQGDSKLVCLQVTGAWKVENKKLITLHEEVKKLQVLFEVFSIAHIRREYNSEADALANEAVSHGEPAREVVKPQPGCCFSSL